jgi:hypothetical protein
MRIYHVEIMNAYLYLLIHTSGPGYVKVGRTINHPRRRLAAHNTRGITGEIAKAAGKPWELIHYVPVTDAVKAEAHHYDEFHRFGHREIMGLSMLEWALNSLLKSEFLDRACYEAMLEDELRDYDVTDLLDCMRLQHKADAAFERRKSALKRAETRRRNRARKAQIESGS